VWGWVFDFGSTHHQFQVFEKKSVSKNCQFQVFENFQNQRIARSGYLKKKNQIQRTTPSSYFKKIQRTARFHKRPDKHPGIVLR
jgi:type II restriction/modification system DNA methylase subunit YeeA